MINFVVCDDEQLFRKKVAMLIDKILMDNPVDYRIHEFNRHNKEFENYINNTDASKIYILDIEMPGSISGIDVARRIRKTDWDSIIIMVTSHAELGYEALKAQIMLLDFISKYDECEKNLEVILQKAVKKIDSKKVFNFKSSGITHRLYLDDILYVTKDTVDRKCIIKTAYNEFFVSKNMNEMIAELGQTFYLSHRSCLINLDRIKNIDWKNNSIEFDNGVTTNLLSRDKKKGLKDYVSVS